MKKYSDKMSRRSEESEMSQCLAGNERLHALVEEECPNICEISVIRDGKTIYEDYWNGYRENDALNVMSVTKSVVSLLTGIAIERGFVGSVDMKVLDFFPDYSVKRGEKTIQEVTIRHLLTMTAPYKYKSEPWTKVCTSDDWTRSALDLLGGRKGLTGEFKYATLGIQILNGILRQATGKRVIDFANEELFGPLGIPAARAHNDVSKEDQLSYIMDKSPRAHEWYTEPGGEVTAGWGLTLSASDMAKIGAMLLSDGSVKGHQIVSRAWIDEMTTPVSRLDERFGNCSYGYLWWIPDENSSAFSAMGDSGNVIYINPELHVSVGIASSFKPAVFDRIDFIEKKLLPEL